MHIIMANVKTSHYIPRKIQKIKFDKFKNLDGLEIDLSGHNVTCLFGCNGIGKSTILSVLRCVFQPTDRRKAKEKKLPPAWKEKMDLNVQNINFSSFCFSPQERWHGSSISIDLVDWLDESKQMPYTYTKQNGKRWKPEMRQRPCKLVYYLGLESCVPVIEQDNTQRSRKRRMKYYASILNNNVDIAHSLTSILGKPFAELESSDFDADNNPKDIELKKEGNLFHMVDLSAGEQRLLRMLQIFYRAKEFSLILIDEIELTLHPLALSNLITKIAQIADAKHLQVIFTSHRGQLLKMRDKINIRSLYKYNTKILCENGAVPNCLEQVYGYDYEGKPTIFYEDKLSVMIIRRILDEIGQRKKFHTEPFGSYEKGFMVASALRSINQLNDNMLFVLDGDVCVTAEEKREKATQWHTSDDSETGKRIDDVAMHFTQYKLPKNSNIEKYIYETIIADHKQNSEVHIAARNISATPIIPPEVTDKDQRKYLEKHYYVSAMIRELGIGEEEALKEIIQVFSSYTQIWEDFIEEVKKRIEAIP